MKRICIYCGEREATTRDHVPPQCFFPKPRPENLITVPCCEECNKSYGKDDERARNIITSIETTEDHPAIETQIAEKRNKSFTRDEGKSNVQHMLDSMSLVDRFTPGGIYLGKTLAFNLDQGVINRFVERIIRGLLYHERSIGYVEFDLKWRLSPAQPDLEKMSPEFINYLLRPNVMKTIGDHIFSYAGFYDPSKANSLWFLNFYGGVEFMSIVREKQ